MANGCDRAVVIGRHFAGRAWGGMGKLLWMERFRFAAYGAASRLPR